MKKPKRPLVGYEPDPEFSRFAMQALVYNLNSAVTFVPTEAGISEHDRVADYSVMKAELRRLVEAWKASGPNLVRLFDRYPELKHRTRHGRTLFIATRTGRGHLSWLPTPTDLDMSSQKDDALTHFMGLITNPYWELLGGPCHRCGSYYIKRTKRQKVYCSKTCGSRNTAIGATQTRRLEEHEQKLALAQKYLGRCPRSILKSGWKVWVSQKTGITIKFLTRAINNGELRVP